MDFHRSDGKRLEYFQYGDGPPVLFLPGLGSDASIWEPQLSALSSAFCCVAVNHRGIGGSDSGDEEYGLADLADDAVALLDHLEFDTVHVVGASMGGLVAQYVALRHPKRVRTLSIHSSWCYTSPLLRLKFEVQDKLLDHLDVVTTSYSLAPMIWSEHTLVHRRQVIEDFRNRRGEAAIPSKEIYRRQIRATLDTDLRGRLVEMTMPVLLTHGAQDQLIPPSCSDLILECVPDASYLVFPTAGHAASIECAADFNRVQRSFLKELEKEK